MLTLVDLTQDMAMLDILYVSADSTKYEDYLQEMCDRYELQEDDVSFILETRSKNIEELFEQSSYSLSDFEDDEMDYMEEDS